MRGGWRRIRSREQYQDFLKCLNLFAQEIIAKGELQIMVQDILGRYPDLLARTPSPVSLSHVSFIICVFSFLLLFMVIVRRMSQRVWEWLLRKGRIRGATRHFERPLIALQLCRLGACKGTATVAA